MSERINPLTLIVVAALLLTGVSFLAGRFSVQPDTLRLIDSTHEVRIETQLVHDTTYMPRAPYRVMDAVPTTREVLDSDSAFVMRPTTFTHSSEHDGDSLDVAFSLRGPAAGVFDILLRRAPTTIIHDSTKTIRQETITSTVRVPDNDSWSLGPSAFVGAMPAIDAQNQVRMQTVYGLGVSITYNLFSW